MRQAALRPIMSREVKSQKSEADRFPLPISRPGAAVEESNLLNQIMALKEKLNRAMRRTEGLKEKSKCLEMQYHDAREREARTSDLVMELIERQRELNVMLNRANIMIHRSQEALALTSTEFNEMAKALPERKKVEWADRVAKVNELFKKTGFEDAETAAGSPAPQAEAFDAGELKKESDEAFARTSIWNRAEKHNPERVEAMLLEDDNPCPHAEPADNIVHRGAASEETCASDDEPFIQQQRKSWWQVLGL